MISNIADDENVAEWRIHLSRYVLQKDGIYTYRIFKQSAFLSFPHFLMLCWNVPVVKMEQRVGVSSRPTGGVRNTPPGLFVSSHLSKFHLQPRVYNLTHLQKRLQLLDRFSITFGADRTLSLIRGKASDKNHRHPSRLFCVLQDIICSAAEPP